MKHIKTIFREPLVHFLLIGAGLFLIFGLTQESGDDASKRITVSLSQVEQLAAQFKRTLLRQPTEEELAGVIEGYVRDEVYYREAMAMGLDRNDPQVRMRMRLKLEFLLEDLTTEAPPDDETLQSYLQQHADKFLMEPQVSFQQVYFNPDKHQDLDADVQRAMARLKAGAPAESLGDSTLLHYQYTEATRTDVAGSYGEDFARQVVALTPGEWGDPLISHLGVHLVKVSERVPGRIPDLAEIRAQVEREYLAQRRKEMKKITYRKLREGYQVVVEPPVAAENKSGEAMAATRSKEAGQ